MTTEQAEVKKAHKFLPFPKPPKQVLIAVLIVLGVGVLVFGASAAVQLAYRERIYPNVHIAGVDVGGLDRVAALEKIQETYDTMLDKGLLVQVDDETHTIALRGDGADLTFNLIDLDVAHEVDAAFLVGREGSVLEKAARPLLLTAGMKTYQLDSLTLHEEQIMSAIRSAFPDAEEPTTPTDFTITKKGEEYTITVVEGKTGTSLADVGPMALLADDARDLSLQSLQLWHVVSAPDVTAEEANTLVNEVVAALKAAPYTLTYTPETRTTPLTWTITETQLIDWILPGFDEDGGLVVALDATQMTELLSQLHEDIDVAPQDAVFSMENNRVTKFSPSHDGVTVNDGDTLTAASAFLGTENTEIMVAVDRIAPAVSTETVNNFGIKEPLGTGYSSFTGSPSNRMKNIQNGASKLNGLLIAPGETVSLIEQLSPFTYENGYLPELVIKGDEIKPEMGGGLCQIGTTTFRAVMNSGLKVVERRNHSLVVTYYNDPSNGKPGTDATIYEPSPDFKFLNDTANHILLMTEVDMETKELFFTFWGTSDGREGSYEPPQVLSWSGYGATQYKETTSLAPGVKQCQSPHPGATTTFTYTVEYADGTVYEEEFTSVYRSLPQICLVGKEEGAEEVPTDDSQDAADSTTGGTIEEPVQLE